MSGKKRLTTKDYEDALRESGGVITVAANKLGVTRQQVHAKIRKNPKLREAAADGSSAIVDLAEIGLIKHLKKEEPWAIKLTLLTKGKGRGYTYKIEQETTNEVVHHFPEALPIKLIIDEVDLDEV